MSEVEQGQAAPELPVAYYGRMIDDMTPDELRAAFRTEAFHAERREKYAHAKLRRVLEDYALAQKSFCIACIERDEVLRRYNTLWWGCVLCSGLGLLGLALRFAL